MGVVNSANLEDMIRRVMEREVPELPQPSWSADELEAFQAKYPLTAEEQELIRCLIFWAEDFPEFDPAGSLPRLARELADQLDAMGVKGC